MAPINTDVIAIVATLLAGFVPPLIAYIREKRISGKKEAQIQQLTKENSTIGEELEKTKKAFPKDLEIIDNVTEVLKDKLLPIIIKQAAKGKPVKIENLGLDMETVMPWINHQIVDSDKLLNIRFQMKSLIINPESGYLKDLIGKGGHISATTVNASIQAANDLIHHDLFGFTFEMRQYDLPPIFHGFLLNDEHLFIGFTEISNGKLLGGKKPYLHLCKKPGEVSDITSHYFNFFKNWFDYYWSISKEVANVSK